MKKTKEQQSIIWEFYKPRQVHAWNMLVLSLDSLEHLSHEDERGFEAEYAWENVIIRLWLYRTTVQTLIKIDRVAIDAQQAVKRFDANFDIGGRNGLKALRDMIEHFNDYAAGAGHGPAKRDIDLDPWRTFTKDCYERGSFRLERMKSLEAAIALQADAKKASDEFIAWFRSSPQ
ncbi:hypothetical protein [Azospirillum sp. B4]|uniref:hypothetical protein n=1 Tax=Azospirillum sp. B4 TaxID=95605 RepID=UPI000A2F120A|nr:hypothetical protein [Azospirillum sp. B4]